MTEVQEIGFKKFGTELRRGWPPADFSWQCYYMLGNTNKLSVLFQLSSGVVVTLETFLGLGRVTNMKNQPPNFEQLTRHARRANRCLNGCTLKLLVQAYIACELH